MQRSIIEKIMQMPDTIIELAANEIESISGGMSRRNLKYTICGILLGLGIRGMEWLAAKEFISANAKKTSEIIFKHAHDISNHIMYYAKIMEYGWLTYVVMFPYTGKNRERRIKINVEYFEGK